MKRRHLVLACAAVGLMVALVLIEGGWPIAEPGSAGFGYGRTSVAPVPVRDAQTRHDVQAQGAGSRTQAASTGHDATQRDVAAIRTGSSAAPATATTTNGSTLQRAVVPDLNGFGQVMPALYLDVPAGWHGEGGFDWLRQTPCAQAVPALHWQAGSADGRHAFEILPQQIWQWTDGGMNPVLPGCPFLQLDSAQAYLQSLAQQRRPNGRALDYRNREDLRAQVQVPPAMAPLSDGSIRSESRADAGEILIAWSEHGIEMRESIAVSMLIEETHAVLAPGQVMRSRIVTAYPAAALRAPDSELDLELSTRIIASMQPDPAWQAQMQAHQQAMAGIAQRGASERSRIHQESQAEVNRIRNQTWWDHQRADHEGHRRVRDAVVGSQRYHDAQTGQEHELSNHYQHAWQLDDGSRVQTDDPGFQPYRDLGVDGRQLDPVR